MMWSLIRTRDGALPGATSKHCFINREGRHYPETFRTGVHEMFMKDMQERKKPEEKTKKADKQKKE